MPRTKTIELYKFYELPSEAQEKAIERFRDNNHEIAWQSELLESFKAVYAAMGLKLIDYSLGLCSYSYVKLDLDSNIKDLTGARALAWIEHNLLSGLRVKRTKDKAKRANNLKYGYRVGSIPDCPLTGYCTDMDFLDAIQAGIKAGDTLGEVLTVRLVEKYIELLQSEYDYQNSDEYIAEHFTVNDYEFTKTGALA